VPAGEVGLREASYHLEYYLQEEHLDLVVVTVPEEETVFIAVAGLPSGGDGNDSGEDGLRVHPASGLDTLELTEVGGLFRDVEGGAELPSFNVSLPVDAEGPVTYVVGVRTIAGLMDHMWDRALVIYPGLHHHVTLASQGGLQVQVSNLTTVDQPFEDSAYEELPDSYVEEPGKLHWHGEVGEDEEAPGFGSALAVVAVMVAIPLVSRGRRD
jgi:hypothetical protein